MAGFDVLGRPGELALHAFSRDDYHRMGELGMLGKRVELIEGVIYDMSPVRPRHFAVVARIDFALQRAFAGKYIVSVQLPILIPPDSEPMPDIAVLAYREDFYGSGLPEPKDVLLLIEIADTTLARDRAKAGLYAAGGVAEYWLLDVNSREVVIHRRPSADHYTEVERVGPDGTAVAALGWAMPVSAFL